jgi:hypothetical protein
MSLVLGVEIIGEYKQLTAATNGAQKQLGTFNDKVTKASKAMKSALASIGIGLSFNAAINAFSDLTKAAIDDRKSMELLAIAMRNTGKANNEQVAAAEKAIGKMQFQAGVADDKLRPAYQKLFIATKDVTRSNELLQIALDASAATGKDLDTVSQAMARSLAGSDTALTKLIPSLKGSKDPIEQMAKAFAGASEEAANLDPYKKLETVMGDVQDRIGAGLLPSLDKLSDWMSSSEGIGTINSATTDFQIFLNKINLIIEGSEILTTKMTNLFSTITGGLKVSGINAWFDMVLDKINKILNPLQNMIDLLAGVSVLLGAGQPSYSLPNVPSSTLDKVAANSGITSAIKAPLKAPAKPPVVVNVKATQSPQQIATAINKGSFYSGTQLLRGGR